MLNFGSGFGCVRVLVAAGREIPIAGDIGVGLRALADGFHLSLEHQADDQRKKHRHGGDDGDGSPGAAADRMPGSGFGEKIVAAGNEVVHAERVVVVDLPGSLIDAVIVVAVVVNGDNIDAHIIWRQHNLEGSGYLCRKKLKIVPSIWQSALRN